MGRLPHFFSYGAPPKRVELCYNQGVKREGVEASGVEQSGCDARVWALPRDETRWRTLQCIIRALCRKSYPPEGQPRSTSDEFLANISFILFS